MSRFNPRLYHPYQSTIMQRPMRSCQVRVQKNTTNVAGRVFVEGAYIPLLSLETTRSVRFAIATELKKTDEDDIKELLKRVEVNDAGAIYVLGNIYHVGLRGLQQDRAKALELN